MGGTEYKCVATKSKKRSFRGNKYTKSQGGTEDMPSADQVDGNGSAVISGEQSTSSSAPLKKKIVRAHHMPYMTKTLRKAIMRRSALENKYYKSKSLKDRGL